MAVKRKSAASLSTRARRDPALLKRALADPGLRSRLADNLLSPEMLKLRRENQFRQNIGDVSKPLTGDSLIRTAETLVDREGKKRTADIDRSAKKVTAGRDQQASFSKANYDRSNGLMQSIIGGQQKANADTVARQQQLGEQAQAGAGEAQIAMAKRAREDAEIRGQQAQEQALQPANASVDATKARIAENTQSAASEANANGTGVDAFLRSLGVAGAMRGQSAQEDIGRRGAGQLADLEAERKQIREDKDGAFTDTLMKLRGGEVERYLTERGLATDAEKARLDAEAEMAKITSQNQLEAAKRRHEVRLEQMGLTAKEALAEADRTFDATQKQLDRDSAAALNAEDNATSRANAKERSGAKKSFTGKDLQKAANERGRARNQAISLKREVPGITPNKLKIALREDIKDETLVEIAVLRAFRKPIPAYLRRRLKKQRGIDLPRGF
jgi:hypothetical protein